MFYIWVKYDTEYEPHMTFTNEKHEEARFEIEDLKEHGHKAKFGEEF